MTTDIVKSESSKPIHVSVSNGRRKVSSESMSEDDLNEIAVTVVGMIFMV